jgi:hypothetical protein
LAKSFFISSLSKVVPFSSLAEFILIIISSSAN